MRTHPFARATLLSTALVLSSAVASAQSASSTASSSTQAAPTTTEGERPRTAYSWFPTARFQLGGAVGADRGGTLAGSLSFDALFGALRYPTEMLDRPSSSGVGIALLPELGFTYDSHPALGGSYFITGLTAYYGTGMVAGGLGVRGLLGDARSGLGGGFRTTLQAMALYSIVHLEVGHQWIRTANEDRHEFRAVVGVNLMPVVFVLIAATGMFRPRG